MINDKKIGGTNAFEFLLANETEHHKPPWPKERAKIGSDRDLAINEN